MFNIDQFQTNAKQEKLKNNFMHYGDAENWTKWPKIKAYCCDKINLRMAEIFSDF